MAAVIDSKAARHAILSRLKAQVSGADQRQLPPEPAFDYPQLDQSQRIERLVNQLTASHAQVIKTNLQDIGKVVEQQLASLKIDSLLYGKNSQYSAVIESMGAKVKLQPFDFMVEGQAKQWLFDHMPAAITGSHCAIAATGSIVLWPTVNEPRTMSLVPPVHFVIVKSDQIYADFTTLINQQQWQEKLPTNVLLISGPSKTADIQQTLAYGAHGPKQLIVFMI